MSPRAGHALPVLLSAVLAIVLLQPGCRRTAPSSPSERYLEGLRASGLDRSALGRDWIARRDAAVRGAAPAPTPFRTAGTLDAAEPRALAWRWTLSRGRRLSVAATLDPADAGQLFVDLLTLETDGTARLVTWLAPGRTSMVHEIDRDGAYVVRLQPELLRGGRFTIAQRTLASLPFPLAGETEGSRSPFGAARDAGARRHEGVDIFAPRGTPVVAVARGLARSDTNRLGGNVVWLHEPFGARTFYYAISIAGRSTVSRG
jgi:murein DD-endopeptidase MepM/ murein hydrolase activator NlpD